MTKYRLQQCVIGTMYVEIEADSLEEAASRAKEGDYDDNYLISYDPYNKDWDIDSWDCDDSRALVDLLMGYDE